MMPRKLVQFCCSPFEDSVVEPEAVLVGLLVGEMSFKPTQLIFLYLLMVVYLFMNK